VHLCSWVCERDRKRQCICAYSVAQLASPRKSFHTHNISLALISVTHTHTWRPCSRCMHSSMNTHTSSLWGFLYISLFFFSCPVCKRERKKTEREKRNGDVFCLSVCIYTQMHSHTQLLTPTPLCYTHKHVYACHSHVVACMLVHLRMFECMLPVDAITAYHVLTTFWLCICPQTVRSCMWNRLYVCDYRCGQRVDIERHSGTWVWKQTPNQTDGTCYISTLRSWLALTMKRFREAFSMIWVTNKFGPTNINIVPVLMLHVGISAVQFWQCVVLYTHVAPTISDNLDMVITEI